MNRPFRVATLLQVLFTVMKAQIPTLFLLHTLVQRLVAGSLGAASEGRSQGEECPRAAEEVEVVYMTGTGRTRIRVVCVWREEDTELMVEDTELMVESKSAPDASAHDRTRPAPVDDEHARVLNRAGEVLCPRIV